MSPKPTTLLLILFFSTTLLFNFPATVKPQDCPNPYSCFQPPTSGTGNNNNNNNNNNPTTTFTPPSTQTGSFQPPAFYPPPGGYLPNSPPYLGGGGVPQPRDSLVPTVPWFPYYRRPEESSSVCLWSRSEVVIAASCLLFLVGYLT